MKNSQNDKDEVPTTLCNLYGEKQAINNCYLFKTKHLKCVMYNIYIIKYLNNINNIASYYITRVVYNSLFITFFYYFSSIYMKKNRTRSRGLQPSQNGTFLKNCTN